MSASAARYAVLAQQVRALGERAEWLAGQKSLDPISIHQLEAMADLAGRIVDRTARLIAELDREVTCAGQ